MRALVCLLGAMVLLFAPVAVFAADPTITLDNGQPTSPAAGKISVTGSITVPTGATVVGVTMYAYLTTGGQGGEVACMVDAMGATRNFSGTITGLPAGTYKVLVRYKSGLSTIPIVDAPQKEQAVAGQQ